MKSVNRKIRKIVRSIFNICILGIMLTCVGKMLLMLLGINKIPQQTVMAMSGVGTITEPIVTTIEFVVTTMEPVATTTEPVVTTTELVITTTEPVVTTTEPVVTTTEPVVTTTEPVVTITEPVATTTESVATTTEFVVTTIVQESEMVSINETVDSWSDYELLARLINAEAGIGTKEEKLWTGQVVLNRVESSYFPNSIREVIFEKGQYSTTKSRIYLEASEESYDVAKLLLEGNRYIPSNVLFQTNCNLNYNLYYVTEHGLKFYSYDG